MLQAGRIDAVQTGSRVQIEANQPSERVVRFSAPVLGLVTSSLIDSEIQSSCTVLENFIPTENGVRVRGGSVRRAKVPSAVKYLFSYKKNSGTEYFVSTDTNVYKYTDATSDGTILSSTSISSIANADFSHLETQTDGGSFLLLVNGSDNLRVYDGTSWQVVTGVSTPFAITGVNTNVFVNVWNYNNRIFYIEKESFNAWYLPVNSIGGAAVKLPLTGIFKNGGSLLFGATLSSDSGSGFDDRCVFVTSNGEFAVYSGDPADVTSWHLNGVFNIGASLGKNAYIKLYGDILACTRSGLLSMTAIMEKKQETIENISKNIQIDWQKDVSRLASNALYQTASCNNSNLIFISLPTNIGTVYVFNYNTKAWSKITNWDISAMLISDCKLFFGGASGWVYRGDSGGYDDNDKVFVAKLCYNFMSFGDMAGLKIATRIKQSWRYVNVFYSKASVNSDYNTAFKPPPSAVSLDVLGASTWDVATWDLSSWGSDLYDYKIKENWVGVASQGEFLAPTIQLTSAQPYRLDCELIGIDLAYRVGRSIT